MTPHERERESHKPRTKSRAGHLTVKVFFFMKPQKNVPGAE